MRQSGTTCLVVADPAPVCTGAGIVSPRCTSPRRRSAPVPELFLQDLHICFSNMVLSRGQRDWGIESGIAGLGACMAPRGSEFTHLRAPEYVRSLLLRSFLRMDSELWRPPGPAGEWDWVDFYIWLCAIYQYIRYAHAIGVCDRLFRPKDKLSDACSSFFPGAGFCRRRHQPTPPPLRLPSPPHQQHPPKNRNSKHPYDKHWL